MQSPPKWENSSWIWLKNRRPNGWGRSMGIQALVKNEKMPGHSVVYVIPGISIFENIQRFGVGQRETVSFIISVPANSQTRRQRVKKWKLQPQFLLLVGLDLLTPILYPIPQHSCPYPLEKETSEWSCPHPSHSQKLLFWAIIHRLSSAAAAHEHLPGGEIPRARSRRERATTCMFGCVWLISNEYSNASYVPGQPSNILQLALNEYSPHRKMEWEWLWSEGVDKWNYRLNGKGPLRSPPVQMPCVTDEKTEVQGGVMACLTSQSESVAQTGPPGLNSQPSALSSILIKHLDQLEEACWKLLIKEIVGGSQAGKLNIWPKCYRQGSVTCFSCIVFPLGCMSLGTTGKGKINLNLCLVHFVEEGDSCLCNLIGGVLRRLSSPR